MRPPQGAENASPARSSMKAAVPNSSTPDSRPGSASLPVRPVTARTWQALGGESPKRVSVYTNDLYGQGGAPADDRPRSPQYRPTSARPATPRSAERLQQQLVVGSPSRGSVGAASGGADCTASPSRLQMSTANVPAAAPSPKLAQQAPSSSLDSLLARAAKAVAEDERAQQAEQQPQPQQAAAAAPDAPAAGAATERPGTAPCSPARPPPARSASVSLAALQTPRSMGFVPGALAARDSPRTQQLFQNFAPAIGSPLGGTPRGSAAGAGAQRPCTPSFQPVSAPRPATAMGDFSIKSAVYSAVDQGAEAGAAPAPSAATALRRPYPVPPSTAPAKAAVKEGGAQNGGSGLSSFGIISAAFVAAPARGPTALGVLGRDEGEIEASDEAAGPLSKAALKAMLQSDLLASADIANKAGLRRFLLAPGPTDKPLQCKIYRSKSGFMKSHSQYVLVLEDGERFLLAGQKRKSGARGSEYSISVDQNDMSSAGSNFCGRLRSNFLGTEFVCYDDADKPRAGNAVNWRCELAAVTYQTNVLGTKGPRKMTVLIPKLDAATNRPLKLRPDAEHNSMLARYKQYDLQDTVVLRNKPPKWNDSLGAYCLNFGGRVTQASVKNFQLVSVDNMERIILQFGKVGSEVFTMDYAYPMTALQAFAICLSSFDSKLACE